MRSRLALACVSLAGCTGQLIESFRYQQQQLAFTSEVEVNTKIDLLWVIDNSSSMDVSQKALRDKFEGFTRQYLKPYWDIRIAVITTDTYLANPAFSRYVTTPISGSANYKSYHLSSFVSSLVAGGGTVGNDPRLAKLADLGVTIANSPGATGTAGIFTAGFSYGDVYPLLQRGADYARLLAGVHDGPTTGLCFERSPYFLADDSVSYPLVAGPRCRVRDMSEAVGPGGCVNPGPGESSVSQCVNTTLNDTVRSGKALIETKPPEGTSGDEAWVQSLVDTFRVNVSAGSAGGGSERGLGSVLEFLRVNEAEGSPTRFFRPGATHAIIFLTDEDDQTMPLPSAASVSTGPVFTPDTDYRCDLPSLAESNIVASDPTRDTLSEAQAFVTTTLKYCCNSGGGCVLDNLGCEAKTVDGFTYTTGVCADSAKLMPVADVKSELDAFFSGLETGGESSYFVVAITPKTATTIQSLQQARYESDARLGDMPYYRIVSGNYQAATSQRVRIRAVDAGTRYMGLVTAVGNGSLDLDIGEPDYSTLLDSIGLTLVQKKSRFPLNREATEKRDMIVKVVRADGSETRVRDDQYEIEGRSVVITDTAFVLALASTDQIVINYQPSTAF
jgi:hypothetical protein